MKADKPSLSEKLKSLGVKKGSTLPAPPKSESYSIDSVVDGDFSPTPRGDVFIAEQNYSSSYIYGTSPLISSSPLSLISQWADDPQLLSLPLSKFAFLDTETSGLSGGTGTYAFLVGVARFIDDQFILKQFFMRDPAEEEVLKDADCVGEAEGTVAIGISVLELPQHPFPWPREPESFAARARG